MKIIREKITKVFFNTCLDSPTLKYSKELPELDYFKILCSCELEKNVNKIMGTDLYMINCEYKSSPAVLILFAIQICKKGRNKETSDKIIEIIKCCEECFTTLDFTHVDESEQSKAIYVTVVKKVSEDMINEWKNAQKNS